jgi:hypothetical protein
MTFAPPTGDLGLVRGTSTNLLIVDNDEVVEELIAALWPSLATPIVVRRRGERLRLSPLVATIVVYDVDTLTRHEQRALCDWIAGNGRTQIVSTASKSLLPMLRTGAFDEALYYRLNVVMLDPASLAAR